MNLNLSSKLGSGIIVLLMLVVASVVVGFQSTARVQQSFNDYEEATNISALVTQVDRDIREIQRVSRTYSYTGNPGAPAQVKGQIERVEELLRKLDVLFQDEKSRYHLSKIRFALESYSENFETLGEEREIRTQLVEQELNLKANSIRQQLLRIIRSESLEVELTQAGVQVILLAFPMLRSRHFSF